MTHHHKHLGPTPAQLGGGAQRKQLEQALRRRTVRPLRPGDRPPVRFGAKDLSLNSQGMLRYGDLSSFGLLTTGSVERIEALAAHLESFGVPALLVDDFVKPKTGGGYQFKCLEIYVPDRCRSTALAANR